MLTHNYKMIRFTSCSRLWSCRCVPKHKCAVIKCHLVFLSCVTESTLCELTSHFMLDNDISSWQHLLMATESHRVTLLSHLFQLALLFTLYRGCKPCRYSTSSSSTVRSICVCLFLDMINSLNSCHFFLKEFLCNCPKKRKFWKLPWMWSTELINLSWTKK